MTTAIHAVDILICGGAGDPNILCLEAAAEKAGYSFISITHNQMTEPKFTWDFQKNSIKINHRTIDAQGAFIRYDVFGGSSPSENELDRSYGWFSACIGLISVIPGLRLHNQRMDFRANHKSYILAIAKKHGLSIPRTLISNCRTEIDDFGPKDKIVLKPVAGGAYTLTAAELDTDIPWENLQAPMPAFVQEKLDYPEFRIFRYGDTYMTFEIRSKHLDYRPYGDNTLKRVENTILGQVNLDALRSMSDELSIDFFACDFKTDPVTGEPVFLELNSGPMFAAFDSITDGELSAGIVAWLCGKSPSKQLSL